MPDESQKLPPGAPPLPDERDTTAAEKNPVIAAASAMFNAGMVHRMTIVMFVLFSVNSLGTVILASLQGVDWSTTDHQTRFMIGLAVLTNWTGMLMAFFRTALTKIAKGENPALETTAPFNK